MWQLLHLVARACYFSHFDTRQSLEFSHRKNNNNNELEKLKQKTITNSWKLFVAAIDKPNRLTETLYKNLNAWLSEEIKLKYKQMKVCHLFLLFAKILIEPYVGDWYRESGILW